jgi:hypothetical protein
MQDLYKTNVSNSVAHNLTCREIMNAGVDPVTTTNLTVSSTDFDANWKYNGKEFSLPVFSLAYNIVTNGNFDNSRKAINNSRITFSEVSMVTSMECITRLTTAQSTGKCIDELKFERSFRCADLPVTPLKTEFIIKFKQVRITGTESNLFTNLAVIQFTYEDREMIRKLYDEKGLELGQEVSQTRVYEDSTGLLV